MSQIIKSANRRKLPINLRRKLLREARHTKAERPSRKSTKKKPTVDPELQEHETLVMATNAKLRRILQNDEFLSDLPFDITPQELLGELAIEQGNSTTIYVERDGLSTLIIVLYQPEPTIADLKRAIERQTRVQLQRELRERKEERIERRRRLDNNQDGHNDNDYGNDDDYKYKMLELLKPFVSTGELVYSRACCGHKHRSRVSWRYLWRAFCLFNVDTNVAIINDQNGRQLLRDCGIGDATTLKFTRRTIYAPRKRQT